MGVCATRSSLEDPRNDCPRFSVCWGHAHSSTSQRISPWRRQPVVVTAYGGPNESEDAIHSSSHHSLAVGRNKTLTDSHFFNYERWLTVQTGRVLRNVVPSKGPAKGVQRLNETIYPSFHPLSYFPLL